MPHVPPERPVLSGSDTARTAAGSETATYFGAAGRRKFALLHEPAEGAGLRSPVIIVHPHFEEKLRAHRVLVEAARSMCARGHRVLRFDLSGHGDSEGEFEDVGFADLEHDVDEAVAFARETWQRDPVIAGLRMGAVLAGRAAGRHGLRAILWEPILQFRPYIDELLRINLSFQLTHHGKVMRGRNLLLEDLTQGGRVNCEGYELTDRFYEEAASSGWLDAPAFPARCTGALAIEIAGRPGAAAGAKPGADIGTGPGASPGAPAAPPPSRLEAAVTGWAGSIPATYVRATEEAFWGHTRRHRTRSPEVVTPSLEWIGS